MTANPTELEAEKSEALALGEVDPPTLLLVHRDLECGKLLAKPLFRRRAEPMLSRVSSRPTLLHRFLLQLGPLHRARPRHESPRA